MIQVSSRFWYLCIRLLANRLLQADLVSQLVQLVSKLLRSKMPCCPPTMVRDCWKLRFRAGGGCLQKYFEFQVQADFTLDPVPAGLLWLSPITGLTGGGTFCACKWVAKYGECRSKTTLWKLCARFGELWSNDRQEVDCDIEAPSLWAWAPATIPRSDDGSGGYGAIRCPTYCWVPAASFGPPTSTRQEKEQETVWLVRGTTATAQNLSQAEGARCFGTFCLSYFWFGVSSKFVIETACTQKAYSETRQRKWHETHTHFLTCPLVLDWCVFPQPSKVSEQMYSLRKHRFGLSTPWEIIACRCM